MLPLRCSLQLVLLCSQQPPALARHWSSGRGGLLPVQKQKGAGECCCCCAVLWCLWCCCCCDLLLLLLLLLLWLCCAVAVAAVPDVAGCWLLLLLLAAAVAVAAPVPVLWLLLLLWLLWSSCCSCWLHLLRLRRRSCCVVPPAATAAAAALASPLLLPHQPAPLAGAALHQPHQRPVSALSSDLRTVCLADNTVKLNMGSDGDNYVGNDGHDEMTMPMTSTMIMTAMMMMMAPMAMMMMMTATTMIALLSEGAAPSEQLRWLCRARSSSRAQAWRASPAQELRTKHDQPARANW